MPSKSCTVCGNGVEIPTKIDKDTEIDKDGRSIVKCGFCGATAPLRIRRRNGNVKGLKGCFVNTQIGFIKGRKLGKRS